jgi:hypothetical protein
MLKIYKIKQKIKIEIYSIIKIKKNDFKLN